MLDWEVSWLTDEEVVMDSGHVSRALIGTADAPEIVLHRHVAAPPPSVREAVADPERRAQWLGALEGTPRAPGDTFEVRLGDEASDAAVGRLLLLEPDRLALSWSWQDERESVLHARVLPAAGAGASGAGESGTGKTSAGTTSAVGSELWVRHALTEPDHVEGYGGSWEQVLQSLARELGCEEAEPEDDAAIESAAADRWHLMTTRPVEISRRLPAAPDRVWKALTTTDGLRAWWWSQWDDVEVVVDAERGTFEITAPGIGVRLGGERLVAEEPTRLACTWCWQEEGGTSTDEAIDLRLAPDPDASASAGTLLRVRHTGPWEEDSQPENYREGWESTLDRLEEILGH